MTGAAARGRLSLAARLERLSAADREEVLAPLSPAEQRLALESWRLRGRAAQLAPEGGWRTWLIMAGRGFGKTRAGAEWVREQALAWPLARIAIVGATLHEARTIMVEGESGLLSIGPLADRPQFEPSNRRLIWPNGTLGYLYSADDPESLRGPQHSHAWGDEAAKWAHGTAAWMNLRLGLRLGPNPCAVLTTTPRPVALLRALIGGPGVTVTRGRTADNAENLPPMFIDAVTEAYGGTRLGRQELDGELIEEIEGALWTRAMIEQCRAPPLLEVAPDGFQRVVVGVDPPAGEGASAAACGIVVAGLRHDGVAVVIEDASVQGLPPEGWARAVAAAAARHEADRIVAEVNNGGAMVASVLRAVEPALAVKEVRASRGKAARAEPVAAVYQRGRVLHAGAFPALEDELCGLVVGGAYQGPGGSPDRADALVWALTELVVERKKPEPHVWAL